MTKILLDIFLVAILFCTSVTTALTPIDVKAVQSDPNQVWDASIKHYELPVSIVDPGKTEQRCVLLKREGWFFTTPADMQLPQYCSSYEEQYCSQYDNEQCPFKYAVTDPLSYSDLKSINGTFSYHPDNERGFVVFFTKPKGSLDLGLLSCDSSSLFNINGLTEYPSNPMDTANLSYSYKKPMGLILRLDGNNIVEKTIPADAYIGFIKYWDLIPERFDNIALYKIPNTGLNCDK